MAKYKMYRAEFSLRSPGKNTNTAKMIEKAIASLREREMRSRCIQAAYLARDAVAENAPKPMFTKLLYGEKMERFYNKNSGYDVRMDAGASFNFVLKMSTNRFATPHYRGYNPVWAMIVSDAGRRAIDVGLDTAIPVPTDVESYVATSGGRWREKKNKPYDHPSFGMGYRNKYAGKYVQFTRHVDAVTGTGWIDAGLQGAATKINNIIAGKTTYRPKGLDRGARSDKVWS